VVSQINAKSNLQSSILSDLNRQFIPKKDIYPHEASKRPGFITMHVKPYRYAPLVAQTQTPQEEKMLHGDECPKYTLYSQEHEKI
jgi:hypothetical protein